MFGFSSPQSCVGSPGCPTEVFAFVCQNHVTESNSTRTTRTTSQKTKTRNRMNFKILSVWEKLIWFLRIHFFFFLVPSSCGFHSNMVLCGDKCGSLLQSRFLHFVLGRAWSSSRKFVDRYEYSCKSYCLVSHNPRHLLSLPVPCSAHICSMSFAEIYDLDQRGLPHGITFPALLSRNTHHATSKNSKFLTSICIVGFFQIYSIGSVEDIGPGMPTTSLSSISNSVQSKLICFA